MMWQGEQLPATFNPHATPGHVLCCLCGVSIQPNATNMCINCLRTQVDISDGIQKQVTVLYCKECGSYLQPPKHWVRAELESKELLTFCLKRVRGLQKVKLVDAGFIWTEPHSKRLKVKLTIQKEVMNGAILQQTFVVEYVVESNMCPKCARVAANPDTWKANVQVRQHVEHKRTFMYLEQVILKHGAQEQCVNIKDIHEGIDFYFGNRSHASKFVDFLQAVVPVRFRHDKQLVSHDEKNGSYNYRYTFSVEIAPICRDDLICLPQKISSSMGGFGPLVLCLRVTNAIVLIDPVSLRTTHLDAKAYWATGLKSMQSSRQLKRFVVLDIEPVRGLPAGERGQSKRHQLAEVQLARESDLGSNNTLLYARTHLGNILQAGDMVLGYDLATSNLVDPELERYEQRGYQVPDVVLVRKSYEERRARRRRNGQRRHWKLRSLGMELDGGEDAASSHLPPQHQHQQQGPGRRGRGEHGLQRMAEDRERFLEELEEDPEMRKNVSIYKDASAIPTTAGRPAGEMDDDSDDDGEVPEIPLEELLDGLEALQLEQDGPPDGGGGDDSSGNMMES